MNQFLSKAKEAISLIKSKNLEQKENTWEKKRERSREKWIDRYQKIVAQSPTEIPYSQLKLGGSQYPQYYFYCLDVLEKAEFSVIDYNEQDRDSEKDEWQHSHHIIKFICTKNGWIFRCGLKESCDIKEGMFQLKDLYHSETGCYLDFYCDMFGHNTGLPRFYRALKLMELGWDNYIQETYGYYLQLIDLLNDKGFVTQLEKVKHDLQDPYLRLKVTIPIDQRVSTKINYGRMKKSSFNSASSRKRA